MEKFLSEEEQYKDTLNNEEISRIRDPKLREIRSRHWEYCHKIFLDEQHISDKELCRLSDEDHAKERKEIEEYRDSLK